MSQHWNGKPLSPDAIDDLIMTIVGFVEQEDLPHDWPDDDALFEGFSNMIHMAMEPYYDKDRNYN